MHKAVRGTGWRVAFPGFPRCQCKKSRGFRGIVAWITVKHEAHTLFASLPPSLAPARTVLPHSESWGTLYARSTPWRINTCLGKIIPPMFGYWVSPGSQCYKYKASSTLSCRLHFREIISQDYVHYTSGGGGVTSRQWSHWSVTLET